MGHGWGREHLVGLQPPYPTPYRVKYFSPKKLLTAALVVCWLGGSGWGMWRLSAYSLAPGAQGIAPAHWPAGSRLARNPGEFTAVIGLHPECPCSQATLEELDAIFAQAGGRLQAQLLFVALPGLPAGPGSALWERARRIPGVRLIEDATGAEARRFDIRTSGETRLYGPDGRLLFRGGITEARGHAGDNPGEASIVALIAQGPRARPAAATPVFGCALWNETAPAP
jgi:hypothetical protein